LLELALHLLVASTATAVLVAVLIARYHVFMLLNLKQGLVGSLFGGQSFGQRSGGIGCGLEAGAGLFHFGNGGGPKRLLASVVDAAGGGLGLLNGLGLRIVDDGGIL
jgi:hypothetical protein